MSPFGENSPKWRCPAARPKRPSARARTAGTVFVTLLLLLALWFLSSTGCALVPAA